MFEFNAGDLKRNDEFTVDNGGTWHKVLFVSRKIPPQVSVIVGGDTPPIIFSRYNEKVLVR